MSVTILDPGATKINTPHKHVGLPVAGEGGEQRPRPMSET